MPPQNHPTLPAASRVSRPFQPAAASSGRFQPAALSYGSETAACPPQNPPTLPCSVQWPPTLPSSSQGRAAPGTTLGVELCLRNIPCSVHLSHSWLSRSASSCGSETCLLPAQILKEVLTCRTLETLTQSSTTSSKPSHAFLERPLATRGAFQQAPASSGRFQPPALSYGSKTAACPPQNPPTLPCSVQRFPAASNGLSSPRFPAASSGLFSRTFPATRFFLRLRGPGASSGISSQHPTQPKCRK